ncbi:hypothetical protein HKX48_007096 [Thoreauomyces humboldtii]|nr:hypothetical protein HKX48_007096 [Thoreauomyces humboldtii]
MFGAIHNLLRGPASSRIQDNVVPRYKEIFGHLPSAVQKKWILQLWTAYELCRIVYDDSFVESLNNCRKPYFPPVRSLQESGDHVRSRRSRREHIPELSASDLVPRASEQLSFVSFPANNILISHEGMIDTSRIHNTSAYDYRAVFEVAVEAWNAFKKGNGFEHLFKAIGRQASGEDVFLEFLDAHKMDKFNVLFQGAHDVDLGLKDWPPLPLSGRVQRIKSINIHRDIKPPRGYIGKDKGTEKPFMNMKLRSAYGTTCNVVSADFSYEDQELQTSKMAAKMQVVEVDAGSDAAYQELQITLRSLPIDFRIENFSLHLDNGFDCIRIYNCTAEGYNVMFLGDTSVGKIGLVKALEIRQDENRSDELYNLRPHSTNLAAPAPIEEGLLLV